MCFFSSSSSTVSFLISSVFIVFAGMPVHVEMTDVTSSLIKGNDTVTLSIPLYFAHYEKKSEYKLISKFEHFQVSYEYLH